MKKKLDINKLYESIMVDVKNEIKKALQESLDDFEYDDDDEFIDPYDDEEPDMKYYKYEIWWSTETEDDLFKRLKSGDEFDYKKFDKLNPNIYEIISYVQSIMKKEGYSKEDIENYIQDVKSGNYDHAKQCSAEMIEKINNDLMNGFISKNH